MRTQIIDKTVVVSAIEGKVEIVLADGSSRPLQKGEILQPGAKLTIADDAKLALSPYDDTPVSDASAGSESAEPAQPQVATSAEGTPSDIAALQESILQGVDPTKNFEASAAGGAPAAGGGIGGVAGASGNGGFVTIDRTGDATIAEAGFDTTYQAEPFVDTQQFVEPLLVNELADEGEQLVVPEDGVLNGNLLTNTTNPDGPNAATVVSFSWGDNANVAVGSSITINGVGTLVVNADGSFTFTPAPNYDGTVPSINYQVSDGQDIVTSTLVVSITPVDEEVDLGGLTREGGEVQVGDPNLADGSAPNAAALTQSGVFTFNAPDGVQSLTLGGVLLISGGSIITLPQAISSSLGNQLIVTGITYNPVTGAGSVSYNYTLLDNESHTKPANDASLGESFSVVLVDTDGDTANDTLDVAILDDVPRVATALGEFSPLIVDESNFSVIDKGNFAGAFQANLGADGGVVAYALEINSLDSGLRDAATGAVIELHLVGGTIQGWVDGDPAVVAFTAAVDASGDLTLTQLRALQHSDTTSNDEPLAIAGGVIRLVAIATDGDGDTASANLDLGGLLVFRDDGPSLTVNADISREEQVALSVNVDETEGNEQLAVGELDTDGNTDDAGPGLGQVTTNVAGGLTSLFAALGGSYGADGAGTTTGVLSFVGFPAEGGLATNLSSTAGGAITLFLEGGVIVGRDADGGDPVFTIAIVGEQLQTILFEALEHPNNATFDEALQLQLLADGAVQLQYAVTRVDADGDSITRSATVDLISHTTLEGDGESQEGGVSTTSYFSFDDDGPSASIRVVSEASVVLDESLGADAGDGNVATDDITLANPNPFSVSYGAPIGAVSGVD
uniref:retention module-containing protein n=1 Tax=Aeromonas fluvialis TaxID=591962 RepID=UPI001FCB1FB2